MESALNLCDYFWKDKKEEYLASIEENRIYLGSSFCSNYFLAIEGDQLNWFANLVKEQNKNITLVVPVFTQKNLEKGKETIDRMLAIFADSIDEITVNDYGMLSYIHIIYGVKINLGRLFMKDYRDARYEKYFNSELKPKIFSNFIRRLSEEYGIYGMEFDPTHKSINFECKPENIQISVYKDFCYQTTGQICEYASIPLPVEKKYRPNQECHIECMTNQIQYDIIEQKEYIRLGRAVYFENSECEVKNAGDYRLIQSPWQ